MTLWELLEICEGIEAINPARNSFEQEVKNVACWQGGEEVFGNGTLLWISANDLQQWQSVRQNLRFNGVLAVAIYSHGQRAVEGEDIRRLVRENLPLLLLPAEIDFETLKNAVRQGGLNNIFTGENVSCWWYDELLAY